VECDQELLFFGVLTKKTECGFPPGDATPDADGWQRVGLGSIAEGKSMDGSPERKRRLLMAMDFDIGVHQNGNQSFYSKMAQPLSSPPSVPIIVRQKGRDNLAYRAERNEPCQTLLSNRMRELFDPPPG
jgi:hypothetical protein